MNNNKKDKKKICIIGGGGYIGSRLTPFLIDRGYDVTVVDIFWFGNYLDSRATVVESDVLKLDDSFFKGFDSVLFLAGLASDPMADFAPAYNFVHNLAAPTYAAFAARKMGVPRFIFAESCSVYGNLGGKECTEGSLKVPEYPYGVSKIQATLSLEHLVNDTFSVIGLRKGTLSGWSPRMRFDLLVNTLYKCAMTDHKIVVHNPEIWRPLFAIEDCLESYLKAIEAPQDVSDTFNVSSLNITIGEVADIVQKHFKDKHGIDVEVEKKAIPDVRNYTASTEKAQKVLGIKFKGTVDSILEGLDAHYDDSFDYSDDKYYNVKVFKSIFDDLLQIGSTDKNEK